MDPGLRRNDGNVFCRSALPSRRSVVESQNRAAHVRVPGLVRGDAYIPYIVQGAEVTPELRTVLDAFRARIMAGFNGQGMGRRCSEVVQDCFRADVDAISDQLADKPYFLGDRLRSLDASV